jgi:hypothetical protein
MNVQRVGGTKGTGGGEPETWNETIAEVRDTSQTSIMGETADSAGGGTALARGSINIRIVNTTTAQLWRSDTGQANDYNFEVVEWPISDKTTTTGFTWVVPTTRSHSITYGGDCSATQFFFNETDALFDPDVDGNAAKVKPASHRAGLPVTNTYNFEGTENPSDGNVAYQGITTAKPPADETIINTELTTSQYSSISADDTSYYTKSTSTSGNHPSLKTVFQLTETESEVTELFLKYIGAARSGTLCSSLGSNASDADLNLFIWNYDSGKYEDANSYDGDGSSVAFDPKTLTKTISASTASYIAGDGNVTLMVQGEPHEGVTECLTTDYVELVVLHSPVSTEFCQSSSTAPITIKNNGTTPIPTIDGNFASAFAGADINVVLKVWMGTGSGCGTDGMGGWEKDCSVTGTDSPVTQTQCKNYNEYNDITASRLVTSLPAGDTNQLCFSGDFNGYVSSGDHNGTFQTGSD